MVALNAKLKRGDSECRNRERMVALKARTTKKMMKGEYAQV